MCYNLPNNICGESVKMREKITETIIKTEERVCDGISYKYVLKKRESRRVASYKMPLYSVEVEMKSSDGRINSKNSSDLFSDIGKAVVFFEMLVDNLATPIDLPYILEDEFLI